MHKEKNIRGYFRFSGRQLLASLVFLLIIYPFLEDLDWGDFALTVAFSLVLISAILAVGGRRRTLLVGLLFILPAVTFHWVAYFTPMEHEDTIPAACMALAIGFVIWQLLRFILRATHVDSEVVCSGISIYLLLSLLWAQLYLLTQNAVPDSFYFIKETASNQILTSFGATYFSITTLTTAGFGDIVPLSRYSRSLASLEALCGVLYIAVLIARLMSLYTKSGHCPTTEEHKLHDKQI